MDDLRDGSERTPGSASAGAATRVSRLDEVRSSLGTTWEYAVARASERFPRTSAAIRAARIPERAPWLFAGAVLGSILIAVLVSRADLGTRRPIEGLLPPPVGAAFADVGFALSPDGARLAFAETTAARRGPLWVRDIGRAEATALPGTDGASFPFWSPDGGRIAFFADGELRVVDLASRVVRPLCAAAAGAAGTWSRRDVILFTSKTSLAARRATSSDRGECRPVAVAAASHPEVRRPSFLPDGRHFVFTTAGQPGIYLGGLTGGEPRRLQSTGEDAIFVAPEFVLFRDGPSIFAQRFDARRLRLRDRPRLVVDGSRTPGGVTGYSVVSDLLVYRAGGGAAQGTGAAQPLSMVVNWAARAR